ncbi:MAG: hypothetical protein KVP17_002109 [Porospora cf. gigantea B]|uniref:uncharacterized protein n=1 Tax=Porospora cf. gigantea B TaxID=2853592 RepID=UPI003571D9D4|nr:MAG: hypothetical protein KVP17_002109 [Porospora cf. gigantea B]
MADVAFQYTVSPPPAHETLQQKKLRQRESFKLRRLEHKLRLFQEAVHIARTREEGQDAASWEVTFAINFPTHFGQNLFVVGSCPELGAWSAENAIELEWGPNHVWSGTVKLPKSHGSVEYKYLVKQHNESNWEWGQNHVVSFDSKLGTQAVVDAWGSGNA